MFFKRKSVSLESHLSKFTHCKLNFHSSGDYYVAQIEELVYTGSRLQIVARRMSQCREFIVDLSTGEKKWFAVKHFMGYRIDDIDTTSLRLQFETRQAKPVAKDADDSTSKFRLENGDEIIFTCHPLSKAEIENILSTTL